MESYMSPPCGILQLAVPVRILGFVLRLNAGMIHPGKIGKVARSSWNELLNFTTNIVPFDNGLAIPLARANVEKHGQLDPAALRIQVEFVDRVGRVRIPVIANLQGEPATGAGVLEELVSFLHARNRSGVVSPGR